MGGLLPVLAVALLLGGVVGRVGVLAALLLALGLVGLLGLLAGRRLLLLAGLLLGRVGRARAAGGRTAVRLGAVGRPLGLAGRRLASLGRRDGLGLGLAGVALERLLGRGLARPGRAAGDGRLLGRGRAAEERVEAAGAGAVRVLAGADRRRTVRDGLVVARRRKVAVGRVGLLLLLGRGLDVGRRERRGRRAERGGGRGRARGRLGVGRAAPLLLLPGGRVLVVVG